MSDFLKSIGIADPGGSGWLTVLFTFLFAAIVTWRFVPRVRQFALQAGWADQPNARRLNKEPLPNAGGLAIYAGVISAIILSAVLRGGVLESVLVQILAILLGGSILLIVGFIDDQYGLPPLFRLVVQLLCALLLIAVGIRFNAAFGTALDPVLGFVLTLVWVMGITNAINLMDGLDGLAGGISYITAMCLLATSAQNPQWASGTLVLAALAGGALGFLRHNFYPSKIIMGDGGAYFFGYVLAATSLVGQLKVTAVLAIVPTLLFLLLPVLDMTSVIFQRLARGQNPLSTPGKDHLHHRLLARGLSQRRVAITLWLFALACNLLGMWLTKVTLPVILLTAVATTGLLAFAVWRKLRAVMREEEKVEGQASRA
jgi:UDP-GlcNAc:undecaprenyl-phosphate GlcNAc-1-phosphate transferase